MSILFKIKFCILAFIRFIFSFLFGGEPCVCCGKISLLVPLCLRCIKTKLLVWIPNKKNDTPLRCVRCGIELISENEICTVCRGEPVLHHTDLVFPVHSYRLWKKDLLSLWKTNSFRQLSPLFAKIIATCILDTLQLTTKIPIVPVPPRPGKIKKYGWDQIEELCKLLSVVYGFSILRLLERTSDTQQKKLDRSGRLFNLGKSYRLNQKINKNISIPQEVILVDDVITTGVTIENCSRCLKDFGIKKVYAVALFSVT
ncbi:MAG: ComF family protein [Spirochaetaceae bacterium]|nr:ComF family protein [Spirochaetaceae bacterium]